jgi:peptidoglycan/LPS O-acetylase OafA/YrhL
MSPSDGPSPVGIGLDRGTVGNSRTGSVLTGINRRPPDLSVTKSEKSRNSMRDHYIDRLRGLAILLVLIGHSPRFIGEWSPVFPETVYVHMVINAYYGVTMFFVISGYLITSKFVNFDSTEMSGDLRSFYMQRIGRIIPPLALLMVTSFAISVSSGGHFDVRNLIDLVVYLSQMDFSSAATLVPHTDSSWDALWSLRIEETFYVFLPILVLLIGRARRIALLFVAAIAVAVFRRIENPNDIHGLYTTFDQLAIGGLVAIYARDLRRLFGPFILLILRMAACVLLVPLYFYTLPMGNAAWCECVGLCTAAIIVSSPPGPPRSAAILRPLESCGRLSYEIYLSHMMILWALTPIGSMTLNTPTPHLAAVALVIVAIGLSYLVSLIVARAYSEPLNRWIRRSSSRRILTGDGGARPNSIAAE